MNKLLAAAACATLIAAPLAMTPAHSFAAPRGGGFHGGYGYHGGYGGYGGYRGGGYGWGWGVPAGFALGAALWNPWFYDYPPYYYGDYPGPYSYGDYSYGYAPPPPQAQGGAPAQAQSGAACGNWNWNTAQSKYDWVPCPPAAVH